MPEIIVPFLPGWIKEKDKLEFTNGFGEILKFYVMGTPCEQTSSSGQSMQKRGWDINVWKSVDLRKYLLSIAELKDNINYCKTTKLEKFSDCVNSVGLGGNFQKVRDKNRIAFYSNEKTVDILTIFYYIRCSLAHGSFQIYYDNNDRIYVLEAISKKRGSSIYNLRSRMVLKEYTLLL